MANVQKKMTFQNKISKTKQKLIESRTCGVFDKDKI